MLASKGTARSLIEDLKSLIQEETPSTEIVSESIVSVKSGDPRVKLSASNRPKANSVLDKLAANHGSDQASTRAADRAANLGALSKLRKVQGKESVETEEADVLENEVEESAIGNTPLKGDKPSKETSKNKDKEKSGKNLEKKARVKRLGSGRNPFKTKSKLGPGPRQGHNSQSKKWKCACTTPYKCLCRNKTTGQNKTIRIGRGYKSEYNREYKKFRKSQKN